MKGLNAAMLACLLALASGYLLRGFDGLNDKTYASKVAPPPPKAKLKPETWTAYQAGRLRRLSLHSFGPRPIERPAQNVPSAQPKYEAAPLPAHSGRVINLDVPRAQAAATLDLNALGQYEHETIDFTERLAGFAEDGPIQTQKRRCAASSKNIKSVGMERQISQSATVGVEYVYKEKCHSSNMATLTSYDLPDETGVKLRFNMRF